MEGLEMVQAGWLSIVPPVIAIALALITKEVFSALLMGVVSGMVIYTCCADAPWLTALTNIPSLMAEQIGGNGSMLLFLALLGALVVVVTMAGGSRAYGAWARKKIRSPRVSKLLTALLGVIIFIDDYFNCLTVGTVMRPVTNKFGISKEKLAYIIDATAAPVCIIAPISSWAAAVASNLDAENGFNLFVSAIPFNLYALLTLLMVAILCCTNLDFGPMKKAEEAARANLQHASDEDDLTDADFDGIRISPDGRVFDLLVPILVLIVFSILGMAYVGGFFNGVPFTDAIGENPTIGLCLGAFAALITAFVMYIPRKLVTFKEFMEGVQQGVKSMVPAIMILVFAWSLSSVCRYMIGTPEFVSGIVSNIAAGGSGTLLIRLLPAIIFLIAAFLSFSTGTAWGTFGILLPIVTAIFAPGNAGAEMLVAAMGATLAGSVFGDHCSPISDTTILSSTGAKCEHIRHVSTQIPYCVLVAGVCFVGYVLYGLTAGINSTPWLMLFVSVVLLVGILAGIAVAQKKQAKV